MEIKTTKYSQFDGLELKEASFRNQIFPAHFHDSYSIGILEKGIEKLVFQEKNILVHAHSVIIINPFEIHSNSFFDNDSWKYRTIYVSTDIMKYMNHKNGLYLNKTIWFPQHLIDDAVLYQLLLAFHLNANTDKTESLSILLHYLVSNYAAEKPEKENGCYMNEIADAIGFMQSHLYDKIIVSKLAAQCRMDQYKFIRVFKQQVGLTPGSYLLLQRINKAKTLIATHMPITEVALETGFYDHSHFVHYFKKYIGVTPLYYQRTIIIE